MEDSDIIALYWARADHAIAETAAKYGRYLASIAINILHSPEDSEECVNDTYLHTWNAIPPNRPSVLRTWLGRITRNLSLDRYKNHHAQKRGGGQAALLLSELEDCIPAPAHTNHPVEEQQLAESISHFLHSQKQEARQLFVRRYWFGDPITAIAQRFHLSEAKVKSSLFRTRQKLQKYLEQEGLLP